MLPAQVSFWNLQENKRHNIQDESIRQAANANQLRSIINDEAKLAEQKRSNLASEEIKRESNRIGWENASIASRQADIAKQRANTEADRLAQDKYEWNTAERDSVRAKTSEYYANAEYKRALKQPTIEATVADTKLSDAKRKATPYSTWSNLLGGFASVGKAAAAFK